MASASDIAALMVAGMAPPAGNSDIGFHQGVVQSWDEITGVNTVIVNGTSLSNLKALSIGAGIVLTPGDTVGLLRFQSTYFILGRVAAPGAGAALGTRQAYVATTESTSTTTYTNLATVGPSLSGVYVSSARRAMVLITAQVAAGNCYGYASVEVSGASAIPASDANTPLSMGGFDMVDTSNLGRVFSAGTATTVQIYDAGAGLNQGLNTFTVKYKKATTGSWVSSADPQFSRRRIVVIPY